MAGILQISKPVYVSEFLSLKPLKFVLACETTGGPVTHTELITRYATVHYQLLSQEVTNHEGGIYTNKIAVSSIGSGFGWYEVYFRNAVSRNYSSSSLIGNVHSYNYYSDMVNLYNHASGCCTAIITPHHAATAYPVQSRNKFTLNGFSF